jgi:flagellar motility protein MotE (MotC chaperone)
LFQLCQILFSNKFKPNSKKLNESMFSSVGANFETEAYSFCWETSQPPVKNPQLCLEDWERLLKDWKRQEEERKKEQRAKDRLRLREQRLRLEKQKEERLNREQQLQADKLRQEQRQQEEKLKQVNQHRTTNNSWDNSTSNQQRATANFWGSNSSSNSSGKVYVQGYRRKDGTHVEGHWRNK